VKARASSPGLHCVYSRRQPRSRMRWIHTADVITRATMAMRTSVELAGGRGSVGMPAAITVGVGLGVGLGVAVGVAAECAAACCCSVPWTTGLPAADVGPVADVGPATVADTDGLGVLPAAHTVTVIAWWLPTSSTHLGIIDTDAAPAFGNVTGTVPPLAMAAVQSPTWRVAGLPRRSTKCTVVPAVTVNSPTLGVDGQDRVPSFRSGVPENVTVGVCAAAAVGGQRIAPSSTRAATL